MLNRRPFVVTGEDSRCGAEVATLMTSRVNPAGLLQQPAKSESHNGFPSPYTVSCREDRIAIEIPSGGCLSDLRGQ